jgi:hypothetical protein
VTVGAITVTAQATSSGLTRRQGNGDFYLATNGDLQMATSGDFLMATDMGRPALLRAIQKGADPAWVGDGLRRTTLDTLLYLGTSIFNGRAAFTDLPLGAWVGNTPAGVSG